MSQTAILILQYINQAAVMLNIGFAGFLAAVPADHPLPWWVAPAVAMLNAIVHSLPAPQGSSPVQALPGPAVKTAALLALFIAGASYLVGCSSPQALDPTAGLFNAEAGLTTVAQLDVAYQKLPGCSATQAQPCFDASVQPKIASGIQDASIAMTAAEETILGCDLATYIASHQTPPAATCGAPASDQSAQQVALTAAQNAIAAAQAILPLKQ